MAKEKGLMAEEKEALLRRIQELEATTQVASGSNLT